MQSVREVVLRKYKQQDCEEMAQLFYDTVHTVNVKDYEKKQLDVWATGTVDLEGWNESFLAHDTVVAVDNDRIVGFGDMDETGYLDRLYVHKDYQGKKIATLILAELEKKVKPCKIITYASITAKPFFENRGYEVVKENVVIRNNVYLSNYIMEKNCK